jgi:acetyl esterase/lipase
MDDDLTALMSFLRKQPSMSSATVAERRAAYDRAERAFALPVGATIRPWERNGLIGELVEPEHPVDGRTILYLHGGGYVIGSPRSHRHLAAAIAIAASANVLLLDYRLAPEHPFPAAVDDAVAAYRLLLQDIGSQRLAVVGDSAGGGLTVATLVAALSAGDAMPAAAVCLSPWVDLTCNTIAASAATISDPLVKTEDIVAYASSYLGANPATHPLASPRFADLRGLPPMLIHASTSEMLASDSLGLADAARAAGVDVTLEMFEGVPHVWHWFWPRLEIAKAAIAQVGAFLKTVWMEQQAPTKAENRRRTS